MRADGQTSPTSTPRSRTPHGRPVFALPGQTFGPSSTCTPTSTPPALYQLWGQFRLADGTVITTQFTVPALDPASE